VPGQRKDTGRGGDLQSQRRNEHLTPHYPRSRLTCARWAPARAQALPAGADAVAAITVPSIERSITASIGIAVLPDHAGDATSLLRHADRALYAAKKNGRNRVEVFNRDMVPSGAATDVPFESIDGATPVPSA
jgi:hypothetical protein